ATGHEAASDLVGSTREGVILGTPEYMSPEQARGMVVDQRSDIFALGAILYEMLSGRRAFRGETPMDTMTAIIRDRPKALGAKAPDGMRIVIDRCLAKDPGRRYQQAAEVRAALEAVR